MMNRMTHWAQRNFGDPDVLALYILLAVAILVFIFLGDIIMPVVASIVIAYLLQGGVRVLERLHFPHILAVIVLYVFFLALVCLALLVILPHLWRQLSTMVNDLPHTLGRLQVLLMSLQARYPTYFSPLQFQELLGEFKLELARFGQVLVSISLASISSLFAVIIYLVLVPLLVYFFLMDNQLILNWLAKYVPKNRRLISSVWKEVNHQIGNYVSGKFLEMVIVWVVCYAVFALMGLQYAMVLSALVGLSVIVPYAGAVLVTVPVLIIAFLQWGWTGSFAYLIIAYSIIITLDANILVPLLFAEAVALHPIAIILATLVFGRLWGFWGVFFAIPLAILLKAVLNVLPVSKLHRSVKPESKAV